MDNSNLLIAIAMRVGIFLRSAAMRCPSHVPDTGRTWKTCLIAFTRNITELPFILDYMNTLLLSTVAIPAESYPLYSSRFSPSYTIAAA